MAETKKVEVVISGVAGVFPESDNVEELKDLLFNKQNGITLDSRRWPLGEITIMMNIYVFKWSYNMTSTACESMALYYLSVPFFFVFSLSLLHFLMLVNCNEL